LRSQRLFQLFLNDEQNTSAIVMNTIKELLKIKSDLINKLGEKHLIVILDEILYKMATSDLKEVGMYGFLEIFFYLYYYIKIIWIHLN
jgi:hypothetical protein